METADAARRWAEEWARGWREHDADRIEALYADGAVFRSAPFRPPRNPREYVDWAFSDEDSVECRFGEPIVAGDRAAVEYWAVIESAGKRETLAGIAVLHYSEGKVRDQIDYWQMDEGVRPAPDRWGR